MSRSRTGVLIPTQRAAIHIRNGNRPCPPRYGMTIYYIVEGRARGEGSSTWKEAFPAAQNP